MLGTGMDLPLLDWLNTYAFPTEARFADTDYARTVYRQLSRELIAHGTTRVCMFSSLHTEATLILMEELERAGVTGYVGKVNMDRNGLPGVLEETTEASMRDTLRWLDRCQDTCRIHPILTPRFTPSCTDKLMEFLGRLAAERGLPVQSHLSENRAEIQWVRELHPDCEQYWETYAKYGLWNDRTLMAHCVWSSDDEIALMRERGVYMAHCAASNSNLASGIAPVRRFLNAGVPVGLGSDIAGGTHTSMLRAMVDSIQASKLCWRLIDQDLQPLSVTEAFWLGSVGSGSFFGKVGSFVEGYECDAVVISDARYNHAGPENLATRLERTIYLSEDQDVQHKFVQGRKLF